MALKFIHGPATANIVLIAGPDDHAGRDHTLDFSVILERGMQAFKAAGITVTKVGDGTSRLDNKFLEKSIAQQPAGSLVIVLGHGIAVHPRPGTSEVEHGLFNGDYFMPTRRLFQMISKTERVMDVIMFSCRSGILHTEAANTLPIGSKFMTVDSNNKMVSTAISAISLSTIVINGVTFKNTIESIRYITAILPWILDGNTPALTIAGQGTFKLNELLSSRYRKSFSDREKEQISAFLPARPFRLSDRFLRQIAAGSPRVQQGRILHGFALAVLLAASAGSALPAQKLANPV